MPRLTTQHYLQEHKWLREIWLTRLGVYSELSATEQWYLHDYFAPNENWSAERLLTHRRDIAEAKPALAQCAGRALGKIRNVAARPLLAQPAVVEGRRRRVRVSHVKVKAVVQPQLDARRFAALLLDICRQDEAKLHRDERVA